MQNVSRRKFIQTVGAVSASAAAASFLPHAAFAQQAEFTLKYGVNTPNTHPNNIRAQQAADNIRRDTKGRVDLQIFPNGQMGSDSDMISQVRSGALDFTSQGGGLLSPLVPVAGISGIGFGFKDYNQLWTALDGDLGKHIQEAISRVGLIAMDKCWDNGFRHVTSSTHPINTPADLKGFKIRVPVSPIYVSLFKKLGASPASINLSEAYSALQTRVVDGHENPLALIQNMRMYEVQKYCSLTGHMWDGYWFLGNAEMWAKLPKDIQQIMARHLNAAGVAQRADLAKLSVELEKELTTKGLIFNRLDTTPFRAILQKSGFYEDWHKKYGNEAWSILEKYTGKLA
ncbi:MAG: transporter solute receptor, DctP family protein [Herminiimonas sp.]|nr:transporter solute receptor, DctP family protein [Herminiimonas sp.]